MLVLLASVAPLTFKTNDVLDPCAAPCGLKTCGDFADLPCSTLSDGFGCACDGCCRAPDGAGVELIARPNETRKLLFAAAPQDEVPEGGEGGPQKTTYGGTSSTTNPCICRSGSNCGRPDNHPRDWYARPAGGIVDAPPRTHTPPPSPSRSRSPATPRRQVLHHSCLCRGLPRRRTPFLHLHLVGARVLDGAQATRPIRLRRTVVPIRLRRDGREVRLGEWARHALAGAVPGGGDGEQPRHDRRHAGEPGLPARLLQVHELRRREPQQGSVLRSSAPIGATRRNSAQFFLAEIAHHPLVGILEEPGSGRHRRELQLWSALHLPPRKLQALEVGLRG